MSYSLFHQIHFAYPNLGEVKIITSVVAQMLEANPDLTPADIKTVLCATAVLLPDVSADVQGYGVVHPGAAVRAVVG